MLDGALKVKNLVKQATGMGMKALAVTDHGNMFGAISFYKTAKDANLQAILGCEVDVVSNGRPPVHLPLLASSEEGYKNLVWLVSQGHVRSASPDMPAISLEEIGGRSKGIIGMTGCLGGLLGQTILEEGVGAGETMLARMRDSFEPGNLYVELQDHGLPEQKVLNEILVELAGRFELPLVATNDAHYGKKEDAESQLYLSCIKSGRSFADAKERHHGSNEMYLKSADEMVALFADYPDAVRNTLEIAERTKVKLKLGVPMLPRFPLPEGFDTPSYFRHVTKEGLEARFAEFRAVGKIVDEEAYRARLQLELDVICKMDFPGYFLIVWDFIRYGKENGVPVGPGRGSGAGSIVAYALRITDLDPIPYNLLFERFLNPERVSMPDFDVDFCMDKRDIVIRYVQEKYGVESVGQIATFAVLKAKSVVKDVSRALGLSPTDAQLIANLIPQKTPAETYTIAEALEIEPKLKAKYETEPKVRELLDQAQKLEGLTRHAGKHAAGIVISKGPLWDHVPVFKDEKEGSYVTQYYKDDVEAAGLVKFDFLGLKTLTVIDIAVRLINQRPDFVREQKTFDLSKIPMDDKETFVLLASGETKGVFQLESSGMQGLFKNLRADCFEDIVAAVALYRPGPLETGMVTDFVACKHGRKAITKMHPLIDDLLEPTYGVIVYQEQVMQIAQALAGYSLGGADLLRRAMGKKKPEEMAKQKSGFVEGATAKGVDPEKATEIFDLVEKFAGYGFNKSHSAAYALITYQTAYLKAHFPVELLCGILTSDKDRNDKVVRTIADARAMGVPVLPPDVNESDMDFKVVYSHPKADKKVGRKERVKDPHGPMIRFGLGAVRGLGESALDTLFEARKAGGPFADLFDFGGRVDAKKVNKGVFEALVQCGAFDTTLEKQKISRARAFASIEVALERSRAASRDRERGQTNLFGLFDASPQAKGGTAAGDYVQCEAWDRREALLREKTALGFFVSGHPLERYVRGEGGLAKLGAVPVTSVHDAAGWSLVKVVGMVEGYRERIFKDGGGKIAFFEIEDLGGRANVKVRGNVIDTYASVLTSGEPILLTAKISFPHKGDDAPEEAEDAPREATLMLNDVVPLIDAIRADATGVLLRIGYGADGREERVPPEALDKVKMLLKRHPGPSRVEVALLLDGGAEAILALGNDYRVEIGDALFSGLERIFGRQVAELSGF